jgi:SAM-dependent methyltransferase
MSESKNETAPANANIIEAWNTVLFDKFTTYRHLLVEGLGQHGTKLFEHVPPVQNSSVLDIGCGFGDSSARLANLVGSLGSVVGVDCAPNFIGESEALRDKEGLSNLSFLCADVESEPLGENFDAAYSRFGTMFFTSPVAALRNVHASLKPGGTLAMSVWRKRQDNPCFYVAQQTVERFVKDSDKATDQVTCGPGPFSMSGADMVSDQLVAAGFSDIMFMRFDAPMCIGHSVDEALDFARDIGPAGESLRLAKSKAAHLQATIEQALREALSPFIIDGKVWAMSSTWLVTAIKP